MLKQSQEPSSSRPITLTLPTSCRGKHAGAVATLPGWEDMGEIWEKVREHVLGTREELREEVRQACKAQGSKPNS